MNREEVYEEIKLENHYLNTSGYIDSCMNRLPVDGKGNAIPWYAYSFIHFLEPRLTKDMRVFEYGCGNSTIWYSKRVKEVVGVDDKIPFIEMINKEVGDNVKLLHRTEDYAKAIIGQGLFDIIVIDGEDREQCAEYALKHLTDNGVIIWDNSNCMTKELFKGWKIIEFSGLIGICTYEGFTSVVYKDNNCLGI